MAAGGGFTLGQLAAALGVTVEGDATRQISRVASLEAAGPGDIAFVVDVRRGAAARASRAGAFLAPEGLGGLPGPVLRSRSPRRALVELLNLFHPPSPLVPGVHRSAIVANGARIDPAAAVGALAVVEAGAVIGPAVRLHPLVYVGAGAEVGEGSILYPHVVVRDGVRIGRRVIIHAGAVIGADGFGYVSDGASHRKIPQVGGVVIEDDVEIGANATVDRATLGDTVIGRGTKIDNLVMVAHNVVVGEHCIMAAQTGLAGSSRLGRGVMTGGQTGVGDHVTVGDGAMLAAQAGVVANVPAGMKIGGTYGRPMMEFKRIWVAEARLPDLLRRVRLLERRLKALEDRDGNGKDTEGHGRA